MHKEYVLSLNGQTKFLSFYVGNRKYFFLVDTGASLSVIKEDALPRNVTVYRDDTVINGIGGQIQSSGYIHMNLIHRDRLSSTEFDIRCHVFHHVPLKADGILGLDFLCKYGANINLIRT